MHAKSVMVLGTTSGAGKSWLATALCRWFARRGLRVAPFKAQNMSNNARVVATPGGGMGEIGSAQYFQALAARVSPDVRMNPVLLKPEHDMGSQVIVNGEVHGALSAAPWRERSAALWAHAEAGLRSLQRDFDVIVIEGAGSPAEINLYDSDYVNMRTAHAAQAACLLVTDIDRGGAFAHLYGTHQLLPAADRALLRGFVLNRFRGDASLLAPGPAQLQALTGVPTVAVLPMWRGHGLPEEDGVFDEHPGGEGPGLRIAVLAYPRISNLDEFQPLRNLPGVQLVWARTPAALSAADWIILPGSKHTSSDLRWLRAQGLDAAIARHAAAGKPLLGICGGLQMLGEALVDPDGVERTPPGACRALGAESENRPQRGQFLTGTPAHSGSMGQEDGEKCTAAAGLQPAIPKSDRLLGESANLPGLGRLPLVTAFEMRKRVTPTQARFEALQGAWAPLSGVALQGYEIRHGRTVPHPGLAAPQVALRDGAGEAIGWQVGNTLGVYAHGLFESPAVLHALFGAKVPTLDSVFDGLADFIDAHFEPGVLEGLLE